MHFFQAMLSFLWSRVFYFEKENGLDAEGDAGNKGGQMFETQKKTHLSSLSFFPEIPSCSTLLVELIK